MTETFERRTTVALSTADASGRLGYPGIFMVFQDLAAAHAEQLGWGFEALAARNLFWLTVKTQVQVIERPKLCSHVILRTWPEAPEPVRCYRSYQVCDPAGAVMIAGKTEWALYNTAKGRIVPIAELYTKDSMDFEPTACPEPFLRIPDRFAPQDEFARYVVRSTDIDVGGHMNNGAYPAALFASFSNAQIAAMDIKRIDLVFRSPCFEGDELTLQKKEAADGSGLDLRMASERGTALLAHFELA